VKHIAQWKAAEESLLVNDRQKPEIFDSLDAIDCDPSFVKDLPIS
jgi:hypothetical protein